MVFKITGTVTEPTYNYNFYRMMVTRTAVPSNKTKRFRSVVGTKCGVQLYALFGINRVRYTGRLHRLILYFIV